MPTCPSGHDSASTDFCDVCGMRMDGAAEAPGAPAPPAEAAAPPAGAPPPLAGAPAPPAGTAAGAPAAAPAAGSPAPPVVSAEPCPQCGAGRTGQFCEVCGYDFAAGKASRPAPAGAGVAGAAPAGPAAPGPDAPGAVAVGPDAPGADAPGADASGAVAPGAAGDGGAVAGSGDGPAGWTAVVTADRAYYDTVIAAGGPDATSIEFPGYCPERRFRLNGREMRLGRRSVSRGLDPEIDLSGPPVDPGVSHLHAVLIAEPDGTWAVLDPGSANGTVVNRGEIVTGVRVPLHDGDRICVGAWTVLTIQAAPAG